MAEAVFTISADISPQINERELERQAQLLSRQLNGILSKQIDKVSIRPETGNFRPFQQELEKSKGFADKLQQSLAQMPRSLGTIARQGKNTFLKFTDAINVTRREVVGFGRGIRDTIRDTNLFEDALDGIKSVSSTIGTMPETFQDLAAQVRSGTSTIDQMAASGNQMAQLFQPIQQQGEAARTEFVELNRSIDILTTAVGRLAAATAGGLIPDEAGKTPFNESIISAQQLLDIVKDAPGIFSEVKGSIDKAFLSGSPEVLLQELVDIKNRAQETTGVMGRLAQFINERSGGRFFPDNTEAARKLAIELEQGAIAKLRELGGSQLLGPIENINARLRSLQAGAVAVGRGIQTISDGFLRLTGLKTPVDNLVNSFDTLASGLVTKLRVGFDTVRQDIESRIAGMGRSIVQRFDAALAPLAGSVGRALGQVAGFLETNLNAPMRQGLKTLKDEFVRLGGEISSGLGRGIASGKGALVNAVTSIKDTVVGGVKRLFQISSPSRIMEAIGRFISGGLAAGISRGAGAVAKAIGALGSGLSALTASAAQFAKSIATVTGVALAGLGAKALYAGQEFNVLKQVINASLPVIIGSKEAAAGLLEEVNALNDTSPYARSSFLELTRVLAGFGVEAEKITPLIDAIQQTVAATGGSDQDLLELGQAFARIQSQGRLSLDVLQSFTSRGVDAIGLLGAEMGKTTSEIRDMISNGLIPADKAIDILTKGLKEKFDGATDAVAKNFPGALQRVQARLRDIGGTLLTAFITPEGGGALVDFLNNMADSLSHINKEVLPSLAPLLQTVANALVVASEKVETFVKSLSGVEFSGFINGLGPALPLIAAFVGFLPQMFSFLPVIGPLIAGLGGPFTALAAAIGVTLVQSGKFGSTMESVSNTVGQAFNFIKENVSGLIVAFGSILSIGDKAGAAVGGAFSAAASGGGKFAGFLSKLSPVLQGVVGAFPKLAGALKVLSGPVGIIISIFVQLVVTSQKFREALGRLFEAVKPVAEVIMGALAVAIKILDEALVALEPVFVLVVDLVAAWFRSLKPVISALKLLIKGAQDSKVIETVFKVLGTVIEGVIGAIRTFIEWYNKIPFLPNVELDVKVNVDKKSQDEAKKKIEDLKKAAKDSTDAIEDNYNAASKAVETATSKMSNAIDQMKQAIASLDGLITPLIEAAKAVQTANKAIDDARAKHAASTAEVTRLEQEKAKALQDAISPVKEMELAERSLTRVRNNLRDIGQEITSIEKENGRIAKENADILAENAKLTGKWAEDQRAQILRDEERAQISLNKARQAESDLLDELNGKNKVSIDLAGLSLDQIRAKLAAARASAKASKGDREQTAQEIADMKRSARLDVEDAEANAASATAAKQEFEIENQEKIQANLEKIEENGIRIRENDERLASLQMDRLDALDDEVSALKDIERLRKGETTQQAIILDYDEKIRDAKDKMRTDSEAINIAVQAQRGAVLEMQLKTATMKGDTNDIWTAQQAIWGYKREGLTFDQGTETALRNQLGSINTMKDGVRQIKDDLVALTKYQGGAEALKATGASLGKLETFEERVNRGDESIVTIRGIGSAYQQVLDGIRAALGAGQAENKTTKQPVLLNAGQIEAVINDIRTLANNETLRDAIRIALNRRGWSMPGFAAAHGYAPGDLVQQGQNNGVGLMRWAEWGKEAVLPLTRKFDMARVVNNPSVLPKILDALPRWKRPDASGLADGVATDLSAVVRSARTGGPANSDVYEKKSQREFASSIGDAVYVAVKAALEESDTLGADVDINVMPSTGNERLIAREVKRQVDKALGKW